MIVKNETPLGLYKGVYDSYPIHPLVAPALFFARATPDGAG